LGRYLDEISAYGSTKLFTELSFLIGQKRGLLGSSINIDTTTLSLYGAYGQNAASNQVGAVSGASCFSYLYTSTLLPSNAAFK